MKVEVIIESLHHDGALVPVGSCIDVEPEQAQQLVDVRAVKYFEGDLKAKKAPKAITAKKASSSKPKKGQTKKS